MAWYGALTDTTAIRTQSCKVYTAALTCQRNEVYGKLQPSRHQIPTDEAICTSIMMAYFEMVTRINHRGWEQHVAAAMTMLELRGPALCTDKFIFQIFRTVRIWVVSLNSCR